MPVILATLEAEIRRIMVRSQPRQIVCETLSRKTLHKNSAGRVAQGEGLEFKPQYCKNKTKQNQQKMWTSERFGFEVSQGPISTNKSWACLSSHLHGTHK
jgi:hypothetical protein